MEKESEETTFSKPASYGMLATATAATVGLTVVAPSAVMAGMGSVTTSSAVFVTPVWRLIKRINELYNDTGHYIQTDFEHLRNKYFKKLDLATAGDAEPAEPYQPKYSRKTVYGLLAATGIASGGLLVYAPTALAAAFGSVVVSGASFTKPVIDLVEKVNELYIDTYNYVKGDLSKGKKLKINLPEHKDETHEIDRSISAPVSPEDERHKWSKFSTYATLALGVAATAFVAVHAPAVLVAALGTIMGSAISYTQPALKLVKKFNAVYDRAETQVANDLKISEELGIPSQTKNMTPLKYLNVTRPVAYMIMGGLTVATVAMALYMPSLLTAAIGSIAGAASSFTSPVLKQVGKVNDFYIDATAHIKSDWKRVFKPKAPQATPEQTATVSAPGQQLKPAVPKVETPSVETPAQELTQNQTQASEAFNPAAEKPAAEKPVTEKPQQAKRPVQTETPAQTEFNVTAQPPRIDNAPARKLQEAENDNAPAVQEGPAAASAQAKNKPQPPVQKP